MQALMNVLEAVNGVLWHDGVLYTLLAVGLLFTVWTRFGQFRALTHGVQVVRGKYDEKGDPGAINHFQALSAALSATVGLGNIAGVAIAISVGGPGAVFWMWVTGFVGMALKLTEVTQALLYRNTDDPENPHGGAMWVCKKGFAKISPSLAPLGAVLGGVFCVTLIISTVTGGNMFQAWNVADISLAYFGIPKHFSGVVMTLVVGAVILGGIKRIGAVAGRLVPLMCGLYILAGLYVLVADYARIPEMFRLIFASAFSPSEATGAFIGGTVGWAFLKGMQRALFSNEAGQGSAPIAHSAAKTNEPVREGVVAGLEPFVDTIFVCTITAIVILLSGAWNRGPALSFPERPEIVQSAPGEWTLGRTPVEVKDAVEADHQMRPGQDVFAVVRGDANANTGHDRHRLNGRLVQEGDQWLVEWRSLASQQRVELAVEGAFFDFKGATLTAKAYDRVLPGLGFWLVPATAWLFAISTMISWSYYGEQGVVYLFGNRGVMPYRVLYCLLILVTSSPLIATQDQLDVISTLGTGVMLWANIPIMLIFGPEAMRAYRAYMDRLKRGELQGHAYPNVTDVVEGRDVE